MGDIVKMDIECLHIFGDGTCAATGEKCEMKTQEEAEECEYFNIPMSRCG